jgi:hypothetical protein
VGSVTETVAGLEALDELKVMAECGWHLFPIWGMRDGRCRCGGKDKCTPGKHPITPNGFKAATTDIEQITAWATEHPGCNWGVATGKISGIVVVDVDPRHGAVVPDGLPDTLTAKTGGGGVHLYFAYPTTHGGPWRKQLEKGVDFQADGKYVVVPPSSTRAAYEWENGLDLATPPDWLVESVRKDREEVTLPAHKPADLDAVVRRLKRIRKPDKAELVRRLLAGESLGEPGERDDQLWLTCGLVAWAAPNCDAVSLGELFDANCKIWADGDAVKYIAERQKVHEKLERQIVAQEQKAREQASAAMRIARRGDDPTGLQGKGTYTTEEIARYAAQQKCSVEDFEHRWIIQVKGSYYPYANGRYQDPALDVDFESRIRQDLAPAPIQLVRMTKEGSVPKTRGEILREYSTAVPHVIADLTRDVSFCDVEAGTFYEAVRPRRRIEPEFNEEIDGWLRLLGGEYAELLMDYLATFPDIERPTALLYMSGASRAGKSLLADGLARIWTTHGVVKLADVFGNFNEALTQCPVIFADEKLPRGVDSAWLREQITVYERGLNRKFMPAAKLRGCLRFICASNPDDMLAQGDESFTLDSLQAIGERVLHIKASREVTRYLSALGGYETTKDWVAGDQLAAHVAWLEANRPVKRGERLLVAGVAGTVHRSLATQSLHGSLVIEILIKHLSSGGRNLNRTGIRVGGGHYFVAATEVAALWETYCPTHKVPSGKRIGQILKGFAEQRTYDGKKFWDLDLETLAGWADDHADVTGDFVRQVCGV